MAQGPGGEKTEKPTPKRIKDARKKGNVAKSKDLTNSILFMATIMLFAILNRFNAGVLTSHMTDSIKAAFTLQELDLERVSDVFAGGGMAMFKILAPILAANLVLALAVDF